MMNKIIKFMPILLLFFCFVNPAAADVPTHINGLHNVTIVQGDNFTLHIHVVYDGPLRDVGIPFLEKNSIYLTIYDFPYSHRFYVANPHIMGDDIKINTSSIYLPLDLGIYEIEA